MIPGYLLMNIARRGTPEQRDVALRSLAVDQSLSSARIALNTSPARPDPADETRPGPPAGYVVLGDAGATQRLPGKLISVSDRLQEEHPTEYQLWQHITDIWSFALAAFHRDSLDGRGMAIAATLHYDRSYDNAFWDGRRLILGDGDGVIFDSVSAGVDVVAHELAHAITACETGLIYWAQSGALHDSLADVFASQVKQYVADQKADQADWLIGGRLFAPDVHAVALRSLADPGTAYDDAVLGRDPQPSTMAGYVHGVEDNGGIHVNSGIPNRAFYLAATNIGGFSWEGAGLIWYAALTSGRLGRTARFTDFAELTVEQAAKLFPGSDAVEAVADAWGQVGLPVSPIPTQRQT